MGHLSSSLEALEPRIAPAAFTGSITLPGGGTNSIVVNVEIHEDGSASLQAKLGHESSEVPGTNAATSNNINYNIPTPMPGSGPVNTTIIIHTVTIIQPPTPLIRLDFGGPSLDDATSGGFHRVKDINAQFVKFANRIADLVTAGQPLPFSARVMDPDSPLNLQVDNLGALI